MTEQQPGSEPATASPAADPATSTGSVHPEGQPPAVVPLSTVLTTYRAPLLAFVAVVGALLLAVAGTAVYQAVREDPGITACRSLADMTARERQGEGGAELTESRYRELREQFAASEHDRIREHGTALVDIAWEVSRMKGSGSLGALAYLGPMGTHISGLKTACANEGVHIDFSGD